jgi:hypothetical protein
MRLRLRPHVYRQQSRKYSRIQRHRPNRSLSQPRPPVQHEHQSRHQRRTPCQPPVVHFILRQITALHRIRQCHRLPKSQRQSLAGNRIHASGCISYQRDVPRNHMPQLPRHRNRAAFTPQHLRVANPPRQLRKLIRQCRLVHPALARKRRHANLIRSHRRDIRLRSLSPMHFQQIRPRPHPIMPPHRVPEIRPLCRTRIQPRPRSHARPNPICANNPSRANNRTASQRHAIPRNPSHRRIPTQLRPATHRPLNQLRVQRNAPHPHPALVRKSRRDITQPPDKSHAAHRLSIARFHAHSQIPQRRNRLRHQPFATRLLNRPPRAIRHHYAKTLLARSNCSRKPGRASADHKHVSLLDHSVSRLDRAPRTLLRRARMIVRLALTPDFEPFTVNTSSGRPWITLTRTTTKMHSAYTPLPRLPSTSCQMDVPNMPRVERSAAGRPKISCE